MPIIQCNVWICELCGKVETTSEEVSSWSDPVVGPPKGRSWDVEMKSDKLACPECIEKASIVTLPLPLPLSPV